VATAGHLDQIGASRALDDHRLLGDPAALLGERMPEVGAVGGGEVDGVGR